MRQSCVTSRYVEPPQKTPNQLIFCQRLPFLYLLHVDKFLIQLFDAFSFYPRMSLYSFKEGGLLVCFCPSLFKYCKVLLFKQSFTCTILCSSEHLRVQNVKLRTQLLTICTFPVFSETMYKIET